MTLRYKFVKRQILDDVFLVPIGEAAAKFNGIIMINDIASYIFDLLPDCDSTSETIAKVTDRYNVDADTAENDVELFLNQLKENDII